jgi:hypothetical protein
MIKAHPARMLISASSVTVVDLNRQGNWIDQLPCLLNAFFGNFLKTAGKLTWINGLRSLPPTKGCRYH